MQDYTLRGKTVRAGVAYTRLGDTNTPKASCAPDDHMELMWRERFGLGLSPLERLTRLLNDPTNWRKMRESYLYCIQFPEFTIVDGETWAEEFAEPWTRHFPDPRASSFEVELRYHATVLEREGFVHCDGVRYRIPMPETTKDPATGNISYHLSRSSLGWKLAMIYRQYMPLDDAYTLADIRIVD